MGGLVPAIHVLLAALASRRGCPGHLARRRASRFCPGMATYEEVPVPENMMKVIGLAGWSGAGKTTLLTRVIPHLLAQGLRVSVIKHAHHSFDVDVPGKDSWMHRQSGAVEVLVSSGKRWALMHELRGAREPRLPELLAKMSRVDLVIVEGFQSH